MVPPSAARPRRASRAPPLHDDTTGRGDTTGGQRRAPNLTVPGADAPAPARARDNPRPTSVLRPPWGRRDQQRTRRRDGSRKPIPDRTSQRVQTAAACRGGEPTTHSAAARWLLRAGNHTDHRGGTDNRQRARAEPPPTGP